MDREMEEMSGDISGGAKGSDTAIFIAICTMVLVCSGYIFYLSTQLHPKVCDPCPLVRAGAAGRLPCADCDAIGVPSGGCPGAVRSNAPPVRVVTRISPYDLNNRIGSSYGRRPDGSEGFLLVKDGAKDITDMEMLATSIAKAVTGNHPYYKNYSMEYYGKYQLRVTFTSS